MANTQVRVEKFEFDADRDEARVEVTLIRIPSGFLVPPSPNALDMPADFRTALAEWLDTGNEV